MTKKNLYWNFTFQYGYVITNIINSFVLLPLYVRGIDAIELGLWWASGNILAWLTLADPGIGDVIQQKIASLEDDENFEIISKYIGSALLSSITVFIFSSLVGILLYLSLGGILGINPTAHKDLDQAFLLSIFGMSISLFSFGLSGVNQGLQKSKQVAIAYISSNIIYLIINIVLLYQNLGLLSIAYANLARAIYLLFFNLIVIVNDKRYLILFNIKHFLNFIKIFSHTATSRILMSFSNSFDLVILPRFVDPQIISLFEINRRPIKQLQGFVGRYSVALMPIISKSSIVDRVESLNFIRQRFFVFCCILIGVSTLILINYKELISIWIGEDSFIGTKIIWLFVFAFIFGQVGYFVSNVTFALGDIIQNSKINSFKSIVTLVVLPSGVYFGGILGVAIASLLISFFFDFFLFLRRAKALKIVLLSQSDYVKIIVFSIVSLIFITTLGCIDFLNWNGISFCIMVSLFYSLIAFLSYNIIRKFT